MTNNRIEQIQQRLQDALHPTQLEVIDDSAEHAGHAGAQTGKGHFTVVIATPAFDGKSLVECHKLVYGAVNELFETDIHALSIKVVRTP